MWPYKAVAWFVLLTGLLAAQAPPPTPRRPAVSGGGGFGGGGRSDAWTSAGIVLVGELSGGMLAASGARLRCMGTLQVVRVLKGEIPTGARGPLSWEFEPRGVSRVPAGSPVPPLYGLWALQRTADGSLQPLMFNSSPLDSAVVGRSFLPLPRVTPTGGLAYDQDASSGAKIAAELGAAMENMAITGWDRLVTEFRAAPSGGVSTRPNPAAEAGPLSLFQALLRSLSDLGGADTAPVYKYLSVSAYPDLQMTGIAGRLRTGDAEAALLLERSVPRLSRSIALSELPGSLARFPWRDSPAATLALARTAVGESELPFLEQSVAGGLARTGRLEYLPYLAVMLGSPNMAIREAAIGGICSLLRSSARARGASGGLWKPEMQPFCAIGSPPLRGTAEERRFLDYWTRWWAANQQRIPADPSVPRPAPPARYLLATRVEVARKIVLAERRFESFFRELDAFRRAKKARATATETQPPEGTLLSSRLSGEDDKKLEEITLRVAASLSAYEQKFRQARNETLVRGVPPDPAIGRASVEEHDRIVADGASELMREMTPQGWSVVVDFILKMNVQVSGGETGTPPER